MADYLLDANIFLNASKRHYPFDVVPSFWNTLKELADRGVIATIDRVKDELYTNTDELTQWCDQNMSDTFYQPAGNAIDEYRQLIAWSIAQPQYSQPARDQFAAVTNADAWLSAVALHTNSVVVTEEVSSPESKKIIKLPDVCLAHQVRYLNTIELLRELRQTL